MCLCVCVYLVKAFLLSNEWSLYWSVVFALHIPLFWVCDPEVITLHASLWIIWENFQEYWSTARKLRKCWRELEKDCWEGQSNVTEGQGISIPGTLQKHHEFHVTAQSSFKNIKVRKATLHHFLYPLSLVWFSYHW
jgi:hypothetical protein